MDDVLALLKKDHRLVERMLDDLASGDEDARAERIDEIEEALLLHMHVEEQFVYPLVQEHLGEEVGEEAEVEHGLAREGLERLRDMADEPGFGAVVAMLKGGLSHHIDEEERELLPQLKREMDREQWDELSAQVAEAKAASSGRDGASGPTRGQTSDSRRTAKKSGAPASRSARERTAGAGRSGARRANGTAKRSTTSRQGSGAKDNAGADKGRSKAASRSR